MKQNFFYFEFRQSDLYLQSYSCFHFYLLFGNVKSGNRCSQLNRVSDSEELQKEENAQISRLFEGDKGLREFPVTISNFFVLSWLIFMLFTNEYYESKRLFRQLGNSLRSRLTHLASLVILFIGEESWYKIITNKPSLIRIFTHHDNFFTEVFIYFSLIFHFLNCSIIIYFNLILFV